MQFEICKGGPASEALVTSPAANRRYGRDKIRNDALFYTAMVLHGSIRTPFALFLLDTSAMRNAHNAFLRDLSSGD